MVALKNNYLNNSHWVGCKQFQYSVVSILGKTPKCKRWWTFVLKVILNTCNKFNQICIHIIATYRMMDKLYKWL